MVNTKRTEADLLTNLFQNLQPDGSITAQDLRDLIVSLGYGAYERSDTVFNDYTFSGLDLASAGISAPALITFRDSVKELAFTGTGVQTKEGFFTIHLGHDLKASTNLTFHVHWSHNNATPSGNVKWNVACMVARGYSAGVFPTEDVFSTVQAAEAQYTHHITDDDDMIITSSVEIEPDSIVIGRIWRDPSDAQDTFADNAFLLHLDIHYELTREGTIEKNRPFTSGGF